MARRILVTGGAGFVGSHAVDALVSRGFGVVVIDNLRQGHRGAVHPQAELVVGDVRDEGLLDRVFRAGGFGAVFHFAARSLVGESMREPLAYFEDNVGGVLALVRACVAHGVGKFVLSSTANLFGTPDRLPIGEDAAIDPGSPYGETKQMAERLLHWADACHGLRYAALRYFNAAGAHAQGHLGEDHDPETHLIPIVIDAALGRRPHVEIFGTDYPTPDGTCIRDYVHVSDLADAHVLVLGALEQGSCRYNVGSGRGYSVREVVAAVERVTGLRVPVREGGRRPGDPPVLVAASDRLRRDLGWEPRFPDLDAMVRTAWHWRRDHPGGYGPGDAGRAVFS